VKCFVKATEVSKIKNCLNFSMVEYLPFIGPMGYGPKAEIQQTRAHYYRQVPETILREHVRHCE
jgi:hypothetical protein